MAAAVFNALANPRTARAISARTAPAERILPEVEEAMRGAGIDLSTAAPRELTPALAASAQWLITMGCSERCPVVPGAQREDWPIDAPGGKPVAEVIRIRDQIREHVQALIARQGWQ